MDRGVHLGTVRPPGARVGDHDLAASACARATPGWHGPGERALGRRAPPTSCASSLPHSFMLCPRAGGKGSSAWYLRGERGFVSGKARADLPEGSRRRLGYSGVVLLGTVRRVNPGSDGFWGGENVESRAEAAGGAQGLWVSSVSIGGSASWNPTPHGLVHACSTYYVQMEDFAPTRLILQPPTGGVHQFTKHLCMPSSSSRFWDFL